jgi:hypothetical protein
MRRDTMSKILAGGLAVLIALPAVATLTHAEGKTLAATLNVMVFPKAGQDPSQQSKDEAECYDWAVENSGADPFELQKQKEKAKEDAEKAEEEAQKAGKGSGAKGAVKGAAAGALIGAVAGDAGKGAAIGATAGVISGRRRGRKSQAQAEKQAEEKEKEAKGNIKKQKKNFLNAFSACLEAKDYMVKY